MEGDFYWMDVEKMLEIMAAQRHDFLNHLQVISGLVQMHKEQRVREYIAEVGQAITGLSKVGQLKLPEVTAVLFIAHYLAANAQVTVQFDIQADLAGCRVPGQKVGLVLEGLINQVLADLIPPKGDQSSLYVGISATQGGYLCVISCHNVLQQYGLNKPDIFTWAQRELMPYGGGLEWQWSEQHMRATLFLPDRSRVS